MEDSYIRVGTFRDLIRDRCLSSKRRVAQEQQFETQDMHARSAVPDTRWPQASAPRAFNPPESSRPSLSSRDGSFAL